MKLYIAFIVVAMRLDFLLFHNYISMYTKKLKLRIE